MINPLKPVWHDSAPDYTLDEHAIHIVWADLHKLLPQLPQFYDVLHRDEITRADKFVFTEDQQRFVLARGLLRCMLEKYLLIPAKEIEFIYSQHGKPEINTLQNTSELHFNLSHTKDMLLIALRKYSSVGIDVEFMRPDMEILNLAQHYFSNTEYETLKNLPEQAQQELFFQLWTRKEAVLKNGGMGLSYSLADVGVLIDDRTVITQGSFFIKSLVITDNYQAAFSSTTIFTDDQLYCWKLQQL